MRTLIVISILLLSTILGFAQEPRFAWKRIGPDGGNISCFIEVDSVLLVGTPGGMFRSVDYGNTWQAVEQGLPMYPFSVGDFTFLQGTVFTSIGGILTDGSDLTLGTTLYSSNNLGLSWSIINSDNRINGEWYNAINLLDAVDSTLIVGVSQEIGAVPQVKTWYSINKGISWKSFNGIVQPFVKDYVPVSRRGNTIVKLGTTLFLPDLSAGVVRSDDNGVTWKPTISNFSTTIFTRLKRSSLISSTNELFWGADSTLYVSRDTGRTWQKTGFSIPRLSTRGQQFLITDVIGVQDTLLVTIAPNYSSENSYDSTYIAPTNQSQGAIMVSGDRGQTWSVRPTTIPYSAPLTLFHTKRGLFCIGADNSQSTTFLQNGLWRSLDGGVTWQSAHNGIAGYYPRLFVPVKNQLFAFTEFGRYFRLDAGSFQRVFPDFTFNDNNSISNVLALDSILYGFSFMDRKKSTNGGKTWSIIEQNRNRDTSLVFPIEIMRLQSPNGIVNVGASQKGWIRSIDTGKTWSIIPSLPKRIELVEIASSESTKTMFIKLSNFNDSLLVSSDFGLTWTVSFDTEAFNRSRSIRVGSIFIRPSTSPLYSGFGNRPALYSRDNGKTFQESKLGLPSSVQIRHLLLQGTTLYAATSRGIYATDIATSISRTNTRETFSLFCAPNPSQDNVYLRFTLPSPAQTRIDIHDMLGRTVLPTITEERGAGEHSTALSVEGLSSGVYSVRLTVRTAVGVRTETVRLMVVR